MQRYNLIPIPGECPSSLARGIIPRGLLHRDHLTRPSLLGFRVCRASLVQPAVVSTESNTYPRRLKGEKVEISFSSEDLPVASGDLELGHDHNAQQGRRQSERVVEALPIGVRIRSSSCNVQLMSPRQGISAGCVPRGFHNKKPPLALAHLNFDAILASEHKPQYRWDVEQIKRVH